MGQAGKALNADMRAVIADPANQAFVSAASIWEIAIKRRLRKLGFRGSAAAAIAANVQHNLPALRDEVAALLAELGEEP